MKGRLLSRLIWREEMMPEDKATDSLSDRPIPQPKGTRIKWFIAGGCVVVLLLVLVCVLVFFVMRGIHGEPANLHTVERVTGEFVEALHRGDAESVRQMMAPEIRADLSQDELNTLFELDVIQKFESLQVCEFQIQFEAGTGRLLVGQGLLHFQDGDMAFLSALLQDSDGTWLVYGFHPMPDREVEPWGACKYQ
jgi:hypothetical protein